MDGKRVRFFMMLRVCSERTSQYLKLLSSDPCSCTSKMHHARNKLHGVSPYFCGNELSRQRGQFHLQSIIAHGALVSSFTLDVCLRF